MTAHHYNDSPPPAAGEIHGGASGTPALLAAAAALVGRLPAFGAWWNQDDWGLLARAAGATPGAEAPARWLSRTAYWAVLEPLAGLAPHPYTATRLALLATAAAGLARLAGRLGLAPLGQLVAGLLLAATPLAFTPLYWAAGVQDLLALAAGVWACERWVAGGPRARATAALLAAASFASKETFLGLPLLFAGWLACGPAAGRRARPGAWALVGGLALAAAAEALLVLRAFSGGAADPYARGGFASSLVNLGAYGWYLLAPGPVHAPRPAAAMIVAGWAAWVAAFSVAAAAWRRGRRAPALAAAGALLAIGPALPLARHLDPYLALGAAAFAALLAAHLTPRRWPLRPAVAAALVVAAVAWGGLGMRARLDRRDPAGLPADPLVLRTAVAHEAAVHLRAAAPALRSGAGLVLLQPPATRENAAMADRLGPGWVVGSLLHRSLEGTLGPRLVLGPEVPVAWANDLSAVPPGALVLVDGGARLIPWGATTQALLYLALTDVARGLYDRAREDLLRAGALGGASLAFLHDPGAMIVSDERLRAHHDPFLAHLAAGGAAGRPRWQADAAARLFRDLAAAVLADAAAAEDSCLARDRLAR